MTTALGFVGFTELDGMLAELPEGTPLRVTSYYKRSHTGQGMVQVSVGCLEVQARVGDDILYCKMSTGRCELWGFQKEDDPKMKMLRERTMAMFALLSAYLASRGYSDLRDGLWTCADNLITVDGKADFWAFSGEARMPYLRDARALTEAINRQCDTGKLAPDMAIELIEAVASYTADMIRRQDAEAEAQGEAEEDAAARPEEGTGGCADLST